MSVPKPVGTYCGRCPGMCPGHYVSPTRAKLQSSLEDRIATATGVAPKVYGPLQPFRPKKLVESWRKQKPRPYLCQVDPSYQIQHDVTTNATGYDEHGQLLFVYLKNVMPTTGPAAQRKALKILQHMSFKSCNRSGRPELKNAVRFNGHANPAAAEINLGYQALIKLWRIGYKHKRPTVTHIKNENLQTLLFPLLDYMVGWYACVLPRLFRELWKTCPPEFRHGTVPFSSLTLLKSAPSAIHVDAKNGKGFACMTTIAAPQSYSGGEFCFVKYGVRLRVMPGDLLIAATPANDHCNLSPVIGEKFSVIGYFKHTLLNARMLQGFRDELNSGKLTVPARRSN